MISLRISLELKTETLICLKARCKNLECSNACNYRRLFDERWSNSYNFISGFFFLFSLPLLLFKFFIFYTFDDNPKSYQDGSEIHSDKIILSSFRGIYFRAGQPSATKTPMNSLAEGDIDSWRLRNPSKSASWFTASRRSQYPCSWFKALPALNLSISYGILTAFCPLRM